MSIGRPRSVDPDGEEPVKIITRISKRDHARLEAMADGRPQAHLVRQAISEYLDKHEGNEGEN